VIEVKAKRSARTADYEVGDGTLQQHAHTADIHYYNHDLRGDGEGGWRKCDWTLTPTVDGWGLQFAPYAVSIPRYANGTLIFSNLQSDGSKHKNHTINSAAQAAAVEGTLDGNRVIYLDAFGPGNDLIYEARRHGVARLIRVRAGHTPAAQYVIEFAGAIQRVERGIQRYNLEAGRTKVTDTDSVTDIVIGGDKIHIQPFAAWSGDRREVLSVQLRMDDGVLFLTKTAPAWWDGSQDLYIDDSVTVYSDTGDGYVYVVNAVWSNARNASTGSTNTTGVEISPDAGKGANYICSRGFLPFTNALSAGSIISAATLTVYTKTKAVCDLSLFQWTNTTSIVAGTYDDFGSTNLATRVTMANNLSPNDFVLNASGLALVPIGGTSYYCIREYDHDVLDVAPTIAPFGEIYSSNNAGTTYDPKIVITYALPSGYQNLMTMGVG
jgi:hypothetical protein